MNNQSVYDLMNVLGGIASCATACPCCRSHSESADEALKRFERTTGVTREDAYVGRTVMRNWRDGTIWDESGLPVGHSPLPR